MSEGSSQTQGKKWLPSNHQMTLGKTRTNAPGSWLSMVGTTNRPTLARILSQMYGRHLIPHLTGKGHPKVTRYYKKKDSSMNLTSIVTVPYSLFVPPPFSLLFRPPFSLVDFPPSNLVPSFPFSIMTVSHLAAATAPCGPCSRRHPPPRSPLHHFLLGHRGRTPSTASRPTSPTSSSPTVWTCPLGRRFDRRKYALGGTDRSDSVVKTVCSMRWRNASVGDTFLNHRSPASPDLLIEPRPALDCVPRRS